MQICSKPLYIFIYTYAIFFCLRPYLSNFVPPCKIGNYVYLSACPNSFVPLSAPFFRLGFTPCKTEEPLKGMMLQEKGKEKIKGKHKRCSERVQRKKGVP